MKSMPALLPDEKWQLLAELREKIGPACMIGDGSNDSRL